jgi:hypothetical protein
MPTVSEILRQTGFSDDEIARLDYRATTAFTNVLSAAEQAREAAELAQRSNVDFYETKIVPALTGWEQEQAQIEAARAKAEKEATYYRAAAVAAGIVPGEDRDVQGRYVSSTEGGTPGSPTYLDPNALAAKFSDTAGMLTDIDYRYRKLYGDTMPIPPSQLIAEADAQKLDPKAYAEKRFSFSQREQELQAQRQRAHDADIAAKAAAERDKFWAERRGNNPDIRVPDGSSRYAELQRGVRTGEIPNPLKMTDQQRRAATRQQIHAEIAKREDGVA